MCKKKKERLRLIREMEEWIEDIDDAEMRTIIRFYYRDGKTQQEIGSILGYDQSIISRKLKLFWKQLA